MSNRKKLKRPSVTALGSDSAARQWMSQAAANLRAMSENLRIRDEHRTAARRAWCGGNDPVPAEVPEWSEGSLGDRFFSGMLINEASRAPRLAAGMPAARVIAGDPAHWSVATAALVRAVLLDGVPVDDAAVATLLGVLAPVAEAEIASGQAATLAAAGAGAGRTADEPDFPEQDGPVFLLGACALIDAMCAVIGDDPLQEVLDVLTPLLSAALPELDGQVVAEALVRGYSHHYRCEMPGDDKVLQRLADAGPGDPLEDLVSAKVVGPGDALRVGLTALAVLGELCRSVSVSVLKAAA
jgi:hypothetical protein